MAEIQRDLGGVDRDRFLGRPVEAVHSDAGVLVSAVTFVVPSSYGISVPFNGIPGKTPEAEFKAQYGDVESLAYKEMIARIEGRIDELSLYQGQ